LGYDSTVAALRCVLSTATRYQWVLRSGPGCGRHR